MIDARLTDTRCENDIGGGIHLFAIEILAETANDLANRLFIALSHKK